MRLVTEKESHEVKPWRIVTKDGCLRGPVGVVQLQALLDVGILTADASIALLDLDDWQVIREHPVWGEMRIAVPNWRFAGEDEDNLGSEPDSAETITVPKLVKHARFEDAAQRERERIGHGLRLWRLAQAVRYLREIVIFLAFLVLGDLLLSGFDPSLGVVKWVCAMGFLAVAMCFYTLRALG